ncbi:hypothetical protein EJ08DRAFT_645731 [Tothia fuscella]|uniref:alpha-glucosidase n=1 Tax=Tothia fuscella TaxID=1048955 RepID=A0A9P4P175_9PEZI|nr:hypothetical protein EJ08DRAFT_645731 [Tothia fuscella]
MAYFISRATIGLFYFILYFSPTQEQSVTITNTPIAGSVVTYKPQFTVPAAADEGVTLIPNIKDPEAVDAQSVCPGYTASNVVRSAYGFSATLNLAGKPCNLYGTDVDVLALTVQYQNADRLSINISPAFVDSTKSSWFILPETLIPKPNVDNNAETTAQENDFQVSWSNTPTFSFTVVRRSTGDIVFSSAGSKLVYEDQFIEFVTSMPENYNTYGLGERIHGLRLGNNFTATIYASDAGDPIDSNIYGSHPFYLDTRYYEIDPSYGNMTLVTSNATSSKSAYKSYSHGVFLRNAHGQEILMRADNVTWRTLGGSIDLYFFDGPSQPEVTKQYQEVIGLPAMQQYFSFGYHQCRWGYQNVSVLQEVVDNFARFDIPLETIWTDIDYMKAYRDFEMDPNTFAVSEMAAFLSKIHDNGQHYVPIVDSAIYKPNPDNATDAYAPYDRGNQSGVFLRTPDGSEYIGTVWPGYTVFPDWHSSESVPWWINEMAMWYRDINFDGIWIDMSEVSSFCVGSCGSQNVSLNPVHPPFLLPGEPGNIEYDYPEGFNLTNSTEAASISSLSSVQSAATATVTESTNSAETIAASSTSSTSYLRTKPTPGVRNLNYPPYVINNVQGDLAVHAVSPNATHVDGVKEYDVHNLFGHQILNATYQSLLDIFPGKRPFIIGRSTFAGTGKWAGHWGGDNASKWFYLFASIPQALNFALFGIPMFGVDTCGFSGNSDEELCNRWMQLSAFFPFYRNHNVVSTISQEPYVWSSVADATKGAMAIRYALLPYMYTLFHSAHTTGSTVMRALAWEFPNDPSLAAADRQFLLGPSLLVTPVLTQGANTVDGVFPGISQGEIWYDWYTHLAVNASAGENVTIPAPLGHIPLYVRGGSVLPMQEPAYTTAASRKNPWSLLVALSSEGTATGSLYIDDGESIIQNSTLFVEFTASKDALYAAATGTYPDTNGLANIIIMGLSNSPGNITLNGASIMERASFNGTTGALSITGLQEVTSGGAWKNDWTLRWT